MTFIWALNPSSWATPAPDGTALVKHNADTKGTKKPKKKKQKTKNKKTKKTKTKTKTKKEKPGF
jgi:hypothetical protein